MLLPPIRQRQPLPETLAVPDCLGGDSHQEHVLCGLFGRLKPRIEGKGAAWAVAHRVGRVLWLLLHEGVEYQEKGSAVLNPRTLKRKLRRLLKEFAKAGIDVQAAITPENAAAA